MLGRGEVFFCRSACPISRAPASLFLTPWGPALFFPVLSGPGDGRYRLRVTAGLITATLYTELGMVSVFGYPESSRDTFYISRRGQVPHHATLPGGRK